MQLQTFQGTLEEMRDIIDSKIKELIEDRLKDPRTGEIIKISRWDKRYLLQVRSRLNDIRYVHGIEEIRIEIGEMMQRYFIGEVEYPDGAKFYEEFKFEKKDPITFTIKRKKLKVLNVREWKKLKVSKLNLDKKIKLRFKSGFF